MQVSIVISLSSLLILSMNNSELCTHRSGDCFAITFHREVLNFTINILTYFEKKKFAFLSCGAFFMAMYFRNASSLKQAFKELRAK